MTKTTSDASPFLYFLAGALLPSLAFLLLRSSSNSSSEKKNQEIHFSGEGFNVDDDETSSDGEEDFTSINRSFSGENSNTSNGNGPQSWGMTDAPYKMILCVNTSLGMGKGKIAAQCCHAAVACYKRATKSCPGGLYAWERTGCAKIAVKCPTEEEMEEIFAKALSLGIPTYVVEDAGRTQIQAGSRTVLGLGPAPVTLFEGVTSHLKLM